MFRPKRGIPPIAQLVVRKSPIAQLVIHTSPKAKPDTWPNADEHHTMASYGTPIKAAYVSLQ